MISATAMANCVMVMALRRKTPLTLWRQFPFSTATGLKAESTNAGYNPASSNVTKKMMPVNGSTVDQFIICFVSISLLM